MHLNGFSPVWIRMWTFRDAAPWNNFPQALQISNFPTLKMVNCSEKKKKYL
jgi:hypothetical protein